MNLHKLTVFREVVEHGGFTAAAEALLISQPLVSAHVKDLEGYYGVRLFDRTNRKVRLTEAGRILDSYARQILTTSSEAKNALDEYKGLRQGELVLGASTTPGAYLLPVILGDFHREFPGIKLDMLVHGSRQVGEWVAEGRVELGVIGQEPDLPGLESEPLADDELVVIAAPSHPLAHAERVTVEDLTTADFISREPGSGTRATADAAVRALGSELIPFMELGSISAIKGAVAAGLGVSMLSSCAVEEELRFGTLVAVAVSGLKARRTFHLIRRKGRWISPAALRLLEMLRERGAST